MSDARCAVCGSGEPIVLLRTVQLTAATINNAPGIPKGSHLTLQFKVCHDCKAPAPFVGFQCHAALAPPKSGGEK